MDRPTAQGTAVSCFSSMLTALINTAAHTTPSSQAVAYLQWPTAQGTAVCCCILLSIKHSAVPLGCLGLCAAVEAPVDDLEVVVLQLSLC
jgi:hypothetical protein